MLVAMQPMLKHPVKRGYVYRPFLAGYAYRHRVTFDHDKIRVGESCLQKSRHQEVFRSFFHKDGFGVVPVGMPGSVQPSNLLRRQEVRRFRSVDARIEAASA